MLSYNFQLALKSLKERISLTLLTVFAIGIGLGLYIMVEAMAYQSGQTPLPHKSDRVYLIQMDNRELTAEDINEPMRMVDTTYKDAMNLLNIELSGVKQAINWSTYGILNVEDENITPIRTEAGVTSSDFFALADMPFLYGQGWDKSDDKKWQCCYCYQ